MGGQRVARGALQATKSTCNAAFRLPPAPCSTLCCPSNIYESNERMGGVDKQDKHTSMFSRHATPAAGGPAPFGGHCFSFQRSEAVSVSLRSRGSSIRLGEAAFGGWVGSCQAAAVRHRGWRQPPGSNFCEVAFVPPRSLPVDLNYHFQSIVQDRALRRARLCPPTARRPTLCPADVARAASQACHRRVPC